MWDMKEWFLKTVVHAVWRRKKKVYYAMSLISIAANFVVLVGPSLQGSVVSRYRVLQAVWGVLPQVAEVLLHRSVLYILLNLIVVRIMVKSGVLGGTCMAPSIKQDEYRPASSRARASGVPIKLDEFHPANNYQFVHGTLWPGSNTHSTCVPQSAAGTRVSSGPPMLLLEQAYDDARSSATPTNVRTMSTATSCIQEHPSNSISYDNEPPKCAPAPAPAPAPSLLTVEPLTELLQSHGDAKSITIRKNKGAMSTGMCATSCAQRHQRNHISCDIKQPKCTPAPSLFTIEPLTEVLQEATEHQIGNDRSDAHLSKSPLRKVTSRADLFRSTVHTCASLKDSMKAGIAQQNNEQSVQVVAEKRGADQAAKLAGEDDDNELSGQEFNERVDTFISKFKRNLTMQRQDSLNRLLGLVGGGGDMMMRFIK
eukprot:c17544_g1_i1 orf=146-1420(+)